jgi:hypothetical protein
MSGRRSGSRARCAAPDAVTRQLAERELLYVDTAGSGDLAGRAAFERARRRGAVACGRRGPAGPRRRAGLPARAGRRRPERAAARRADRARRGTGRPSGRAPGRGGVRRRRTQAEPGARPAGRRGRRSAPGPRRRPAARRPPRRGGGLVGLVLGVAGAAVAVPVLERSVAESFGRFDVRLLELLPVVLLGAATGLAACALARAGRRASGRPRRLRGRRPASAPTGRLARRGLAVALVGTGVACLGAVGAVRGGSVGMPAAYTILAGRDPRAVRADRGLPAVVAGAARLGGRLPPAPRLAVRDAVGTVAAARRPWPRSSPPWRGARRSASSSAVRPTRTGGRTRRWSPVARPGVDLMGYDGVRDAAPTVVAAGDGGGAGARRHGREGRGPGPPRRTLDRLHDGRRPGRERLPVERPRGGRRRPRRLAVPGLALRDAGRDPGRRRPDGRGSSSGPRRRRRSACSRQAGWWSSTGASCTTGARRWRCTGTTTTSPRPWRSPPRSSRHSGRRCRRALASGGAPSGPAGQRQRRRVRI